MIVVLIGARCRDHQRWSEMTGWLSWWWRICLAGCDGANHYISADFTSFHSIGSDTQVHVHVVCPSWVVQCKIVCTACTKNYMQSTSNKTVVHFAFVVPQFCALWGAPRDTHLISSISSQCYIHLRRRFYPTMPYTIYMPYNLLCALYYITRLVHPLLFPVWFQLPSGPRPSSICYDFWFLSTLFYSRSVQCSAVDAL